MAKIVEILKSEGRCFCCLEKTTHVAKFCKDKKFKCELCGGNHATILCGLPKFLSQQREKVNEENKAQEEEDQFNSEDRTDAPTSKRTAETNE